MISWRGCAAGALALTGACLGSPPAEGCSRVLYAAPGSPAITGRNMDWHEDLRTNLWVFPRGAKRDGAVKGSSLTWTSRYGSLIASAYDIGTVDGMNERGLVANVLYLRETDYGERDAARPGLSVSLWAQYYLDTFASVAEAVAASRANSFQIVTFSYGVTEETLGALHLALSDSSGDSAIFEYIEGKLVIHHGPRYKVLTNSPPLDKQLARLPEFKGFGGRKKLPLGDSPPARFVRAAYYVERIAPASPAQAVEAVQDVLDNVAEPSVGGAERASRTVTIWRSVADSTSRVYRFQPVPGTDALSVDLGRLDFSEGAPVKKLTLWEGAPRFGEVSGAFVPAQPFTFLGPP